jgi:hypothetical protein
MHYGTVSRHRDGLKAEVRTHDDPRENRYSCLPMALPNPLVAVWRAAPEAGEGRQMNPRSPLGRSCWRGLSSWPIVNLDAKGERGYDA